MHRRGQEHGAWPVSGVVVVGAVCLDKHSMHLCLLLNPCPVSTDAIIDQQAQLKSNKSEGPGGQGLRGG